MQFRVLSKDELRRESARFNDLWARSCVALPTARAEHVLHWHEMFGSNAKRLQNAVVEQDGRWLASLAFVQSRIRPFHVAQLPTNPWQPSGELMLDEDCDTRQAIDLLLTGLTSLKVSVFDFGVILPGTMRWGCLFEALASQDVAHCIAPRFDVALIDCARDWQVQSQTWSANHRRRVKRNQKLLDASDLEVRSHTLRADHESLALLDELWRLEALSWKGHRGDAVEGDPKLVNFYREQAALLSEASSEGITASVSVLRRRNQPVAAIYYWQSKDVCHLWKTAYDPAAAEFSPGSLLLQETLRQQIERGDCRLFNLMGEMSPAHASFATRKFDVARLIFSGNCGFGRAAVAAYRAIRHLRGRPAWQPSALSEPWPLSTTSAAPVELTPSR